MADPHPLNTDTSLRGPLLAAHRALRKAVEARSAELKGKCSAAAWELRQNGENSQVRDRLTHALLVSQELKKSLTEFGGPGLIPEASGFVDYLEGQHQKVVSGSGQAGAEYLACTPYIMRKAPITDSTSCQVTARMAAGDRMYARQEFERLFEVAFGAVLVLVASQRSFFCDVTGANSEAG